jgi:hypothetical protein
MSGYAAFGEDFYVNMNLATELEVRPGRESMLHFFEQIRRRYPNMKNFYSREKHEYVLEEEKEGDGYRWASIENKRVNSGIVNPESYEDAIAQHRTVLEMAPYNLSILPLDCESLSVVMGFDFACRDNHNEILAKAIGIPAGFEPFRSAPFGKLLGHEPAIQFALDDDCKTQCRIAFETRTSPFQVRSSEFGEEHLSVYLTVRRYDSLGPDESFADEFVRLAELCRNIADDHLVTSVLQPLQEAIAIN